MPLVWLIDIGWIVEVKTSWTLNAQNQGEYSISAELLSPLTQGHLSVTWGQTLNGSNNNFSEFKLEFSEFSLLFHIGINGSNDPIEISSEELKINTSITHELFNFSEPFHYDFHFYFNATKLEVYCSESTSTSIIKILDLEGDFSDLRGFQFWTKSQR